MVEPSEWAKKRLPQLSRREKLALACYDPGAFVARGDNYDEPLTDWQARACEIALDYTPALAGEESRNDE